MQSLNPGRPPRSVHANPTRVFSSLPRQPAQKGDEAVTTGFPRESAFATPRRLYQERDISPNPGSSRRSSGPKGRTSINSPGFKASFAQSASSGAKFTPFASPRGLGSREAPHTYRSADSNSSTPRGSVKSLDEGAGIGLQVRVQGGRHLVKGISVGGPAEKSGDVLLHDVIKSINDEAVAQFSAAEVQRRLSGPPGSVVRISLLRYPPCHGVKASIPRATEHVVSLERQVLLREYPGNPGLQDAPSAQQSAFACCETSNQVQQGNGLGTVATQTSVCYSAPARSPQPSTPTSPGRKSDLVANTESASTGTGHDHLTPGHDSPLPVPPAGAIHANATSPGKSPMTPRSSCVGVTPRPQSLPSSGLVAKAESAIGGSPAGSGDDGGALVRRDGAAHANVTSPDKAITTPRSSSVGVTARPQSLASSGNFICACAVWMLGSDAAGSSDMDVACMLPARF